jgi:hypothetical protein
LYFKGIIDFSHPFSTFLCDEDGEEVGLEVGIGTGN